MRMIKLVRAEERKVFAINGFSGHYFIPNYIKAMVEKAILSSLTCVEIEQKASIM